MPKRVLFSLGQRSNPNDCLWLDSEVQSPEIEVRFAPNSRPSEGHAGLPLLTPNGQTNVLNAVLRQPACERADGMIMRPKG